MGFPYVSIKMPNINFLFHLLISCLDFMFVAALTRLGLKPPEEEEEEEEEEEASTDEQTSNYFLVMDGLCLSPIPVPVDTIKARIKKALPVITYGDFLERLGEEHEEDEDSKCPVCLDCMEESDEMRELCNCDHVFHRDCLETWVDQGHLTCPVCRSFLFPDESGAARFL